MKLSNQLTGLIRTWVPIAVGGVFSWLATQGLALDGETQAGAIVALTGVTQAVYYTLVRLLEQQWPAAGWLLGKASAPTYEK